MQYDEDYDSYIDGGGCDSLLYKLRKNRCLVVISLMLVAAVVAIVAGLYSGITQNKYSNMAVAVGIWLPSIILVAICIYATVTCVQDSPTPRISPRIHFLPDERQSRSCEDVTQPPQRNLETLINMHAKHHPKVNRESMGGSLRSKAEETKLKRIRGVTENTSSYRGTKMHGRHFRSLSNSDIARYHYKINNMLSRGSEMHICGDERDYDKTYSTRYRGHQNVLKPKGFKNRSVSDTAFKYRISESREDMSVYNFNSLDNPREYTESQCTLTDEEEQGDCEYFSRGIEKPVGETSLPVEHFYRDNKASGDCERGMECDDCMDESRRYRYRRNMCGNKYFPDSVRRENVKYPLTKPEIPSFYPSSLIRYPREDKDSLHFSHKLPERMEFFRDNRSAMDFPSEGSEQNGYLFRSNLPSKLQMNEERQYISPQQEIEVTDHEKRRAIYFPLSSNGESILQFPRLVPEDGRCLPGSSKMKQKPSPRDTEDSSLNDQQTMEYPPIHNIRSEIMGRLTRNSENNPQEARHGTVHHPLNKSELAERQMSSHFQREYPSKDMQACEAFTSDYRENICNQLPSTKQREFMDKNIHDRSVIRADGQTVKLKSGHESYVTLV